VTRGLEMRRVGRDVYCLDLGAGCGTRDFFMRRSVVDEGDGRESHMGGTTVVRATA